MRPRVERDLLIASQTLIRENGHVVQISKWRHSSRLAIRKPVFEFRLGGKPCIRCTGYVFQALKVNLRGGGQHGHSQGCIEFHDDCLGQLFSRYVRESGTTLPRLRDRERDGHISNLVGVQKFSKTSE